MEMERAKWKVAAVMGLLSFLAMGLCGCGTSETKIGQDRSEALAAESFRTEEKETQEVSSQEYPVVLESSSTKDIILASYSEGIFCMFNGEAYGFMDEKGKMVSDFQYDLAYPFSQGLSCVSRGGKYGFIDKNGEAVIPLIYDRANSFSEGLAYFEAGDQYGFIDREGDVAFLLDCDSISSFREGLAYFSVDGKYGYIDSTGREAIPHVYDDAGYFSNGVARVRRGIHFGVIDSQGRELVETKYESINIGEPFIVAGMEGKYGCYNLQGEQVLPPEYDYIWVEGDKAAFRKNDKWGLADVTGSILAEPIYDSVTVDSKGKAAVIEQDDLYGIMDDEGRIVVPAIYDYVGWRGSLSDCVIVAEEKGKYGTLNPEDFTEEIPPIYDRIADYQDGAAVVLRGNKYGVVDRSGTILIAFEYDSIRLFENGLVSAEKEGKCRLLDRGGNARSQESYESIVQYGDCYKVEQNGRRGFLNNKGEETIPVSFDYLSNTVYQASNCYIPVRYGNSLNHCIVITGEIESGDLSSILLKNEITPRIGPFHQLVREGVITVEDAESSHSTDIKALQNEQLTLRLYRVENFARPVLYVHAMPYMRMNFPLSHSGFYAVEEGESNGGSNDSEGLTLKQLVSGYECGGSLRGDYVHLWLDNETESVKIGVSGAYGGFGGSASKHEIYEYQNGRLQIESAFRSVSQISRNYTEEELLEHPHLLFDSNNEPYTEDTVPQAEYVSEYTVNDEGTTPDRYTALLGRYTGDYPSVD